MLCDAGFNTANYKGLKIAMFMTHGTEGFYYTAEDQAGDLPALEAPWMKYDGATWIQKELEPEGNGWAWYLHGKVATVLFHEPEYHTEKICDNLWYYQFFFRNDMAVYQLYMQTFLAIPAHICYRPRHDKRYSILF